MSNRESELEAMLLRRDREAAERELQRLAEEQAAATMLAATESKERLAAALEQARRSAWLAAALETAGDEIFNPAAIEKSIPTDGTWPDGYSPEDFGVTIAEQSTGDVSDTHMGRLLKKLNGGGND
jgi:membrane protein involved in colicin uptake